MTGSSSSSVKDESSSKLPPAEIVIAGGGIVGLVLALVRSLLQLRLQTHLSITCTGQVNGLTLFILAIQLVFLPSLSPAIMIDEMRVLK
jgi:hypothetical protein